MRKEFKIEGMMPLEIIKSKIWTIFDIVRSENISSEDYHVVLFLLSAYKDNLISIDLINENHQIKKRLLERLRNSNNELSNQYTPIFLCFEPSIQKLSENGLRNLFSVLTEINKQVLTENFPDIFDSVLYRISQSQGRFAGEFIQPVELTRFMCDLADLKKHAKVFNPFAGLASFGVYLDQSQGYFGQELNQKTWALGALRLMAYERPGSSKYVCDDSISHWPDESEQFDLILSNPPFGMRLDHQYRTFDSNTRTIEQFLIEKGVQSLKQDGKLIALLPQGFLFRGMHEERLREHLVEEDLIDTIISLPGGLLLNTGIPLIILVLNRSKKLPGRVKFIDAKNFVTAKEPREKVLNDDKLNSFIHSDKDVDNVVKIVHNEQIRDNDYNLSVARYFQKHIDGVKLGDILELVRGRRGNLPKTGKLIRIRDLKDDKVDFTLDVSSVEENELTRTNIHLVSDSCILLAIRWRTLKPTFFEFKGEPIFRSNDILSFNVNEAIVDKAYLINELHADYVQDQLESYRLGVSMPFIRTDDLKKVVIKLPSLVEQRAKVEGLKQAFIKAKEEELKLQKEILGIKEDTFKEFASIKHTFRQYLGAIKSNVVGTRKFLNKRDGQIISLDDMYSPKLNQTLRDHLLSVEETIASLGKLLETEMFTSKGNQVETLDLIELVKMAHKRFEQDPFIFELDCDEESFGEMDENLIPLIDMNKDDFFKLFSNIVSNAINHGFKTEHGNIIRSKIKYDSKFESCVLEVSNNGVPMPEKFTFTHLTTRGEKTTDSKGTGIGGADIKDIITTYKGTFELFNEINSPFPVTYKINFPISKNVKENEI